MVLPVDRFEGIVSKLAETASKLDSIAERLAESERHREKVDDDHESRIRVLEGFRWKVHGAAAVLGFFSGGIGAAIVNALT